MLEHKESLRIVNKSVDNSLLLLSKKCVPYLDGIGHWFALKWPVVILLKDPVETICSW